MDPIDTRLPDDASTAPLQPWSDAARKARIELSADPKEQVRRAKVARFQDRYAESIIGDAAEPDVIGIMYAFVVEGLWYAAVTLFFLIGSEARLDEFHVALMGVAMLVLVTATARWWRRRRSEGDDDAAEDSVPDIHLPPNWGLRRRE
jgi:hypothetical protein